MTRTTPKTEMEMMNRRMENLMSMGMSFAQCGLTMGMMAYETGRRAFLETVEAARAFAAPFNPVPIARKRVTD